MENKCKLCGSFAINHHLHGRDGSDPDLCDVCYWHTRAVKLQDLLAIIHRDGGHYTSAHGVSKSTEDAIEIVFAMHAELDDTGRPF